MCFSILASITVIVGFGFYFMYKKVDKLEKVLIKNEKKYGWVEKKASASTKESEKRISDLDELRKLKQYISTLKGNLNMVPYMLEQLDSEIDLQERMLFKELGQEVYQNMGNQENL